MNDDPEPQIDYPFEDFRRDVLFSLPLPEQSPGTLSRLLPYDSPAVAYIRALVVVRACRYIEIHEDELARRNGLSLLPQGGQKIGTHILQSLHHFYVRIDTKDWDMEPPPVEICTPIENN